MRTIWPWNWSELSLISSEAMKQGTTLEICSYPFHLRESLGRPHLMLKHHLEPWGIWIQLLDV